MIRIVSHSLLRLEQKISYSIENKVRIVEHKDP